MVHTLPPEHPDSPASTFATVQPGAGVVADDVEPKDGHLTAAEATKQRIGLDTDTATVETGKPARKEPGPSKPSTT